MCLAQFVLSDDKYAADYLAFGEDSWLIMDNGLAEDGKPQGPDKLLEAGLRVCPSEIVLPDFLDPAANIKAAAQTLQHEGLMTFVRDRVIQLMYVPHGEHLWQWIDNLRAITKFETMPDSVGISKFHNEIHPSAAVYGRGVLGCLVRGLFPEMPIHYLGLSLTTLELGRMAFGRSCDTSVATMSAYRGLRFGGDGLLYRPADVEYKHDATLNRKQYNDALHNMNVMDEIASFNGARTMLNG
jgi:hypothetical protein